MDTEKAIEQAIRKTLAESMGSAIEKSVQSSIASREFDIRRRALASVMRFIASDSFQLELEKQTALYFKNDFDWDPAEILSDREWDAVLDAVRSAAMKKMNLKVKGKK